MRSPDKPGTYRIKRKVDGTWWLGGLQKTGQRVRTSFQSESDARAAAKVLFPESAMQPPVQVTAPSVTIDDWGIPLSIDPAVAASVNSKLGVAPPVVAPPPPPIDPPPPPVDEKKKKEDQERAKSLCEFLGVCWAAGDVWVAKKATTFIGKEPALPSANQVNNLAKAAKTAFVDLLGDLEVGPWTMLMLLSLALPASMMIQSRALPKKIGGPAKDSPTSESESHLKSV